MKQIFVEELKQGANIMDFFMVKMIGIKMGSNRKMYLDLKLGDKTGEVNSKKWDIVNGEAELLDQIKTSDLVKRVQEILGKPDDVASNVLNWFHVDGQGKVDAAFSVVTSQGKTTASSYLENVKDKRAASRRYRAAQRELSPVLGSPVQEVPGFLSAWFPEKLQFSLMIVEDEQPPVVGFLLKEPLVEDM